MSQQVYNFHIPFFLALAAFFCFPPSIQANSSVLSLCRYPSRVCSFSPFHFIFLMPVSFAVLTKIRKVIISTPQTFNETPLKTLKLYFFLASIALAGLVSTVSLPQHPNSSRRAFLNLYAYPRLPKRHQRIGTHSPAGDSSRALCNTRACARHADNDAVHRPCVLGRV